MAKRNQTRKKSYDQRDSATKKSMSHRPPYSLITPTQRAQVHVLRKEGLTQDRISQLTEISKGSINNILHEDSKEYRAEIDRIKKARAQRWSKLADRQLALAEKVLQLAEMQVDKALEAKAVFPLKVLSSVGFNVNLIVLNAAIAQDKQNLLEGESTEQPEVKISNYEKMDTEARKNRMRYLAMGLQRIYVN